MKNLPALFVLLLVVVFSAARLAATELYDLGQGLGYLRLGALADSEKAFHSPVSDTPALVLDLRTATGNGPAVAALLATLRSRPAGKPIRLLLISPATTPELLAGLTAGLPGVITIGRAADNCHPDIAVATTADAEQRALAALSTGVPAGNLFSSAPAKRRYDEALLAHDRNAPVEDPAAPEAKPETKPAEPPPLLDAVLQRAVQIHRGLLALRQNPAKG